MMVFVFSYKDHRKSLFSTFYYFTLINEEYLLNNLHVIPVKIVW